jgi:hypothetical protein
MKAPLAKLFLELQEQVQTSVPEIVYIEQDLGQLGEDEPRKMLAFPAVLIDFQNTTFENLQGNSQMALPTIAITLVFDNYSQTNNLAPINVRETGLTYLEVEQKLFMALQGFQTDYCQPLSRTNAKSHNRNELGLRVRELTFTTEFEDYSADDGGVVTPIGVAT